MSILKEINPEYSLEGLMLKLQYFGHLMGRADSLEKALMLGKVEGKRRREWRQMRLLEIITDSVDMYLSKLEDNEGQDSLASCSPCSCKGSEMTQELNNNNMGFSRREYWSGLPCLSPGHLPDTGIELMTLMSL